MTIKIKTGVALRLLTNVIDESNDGSNFDINYYSLIEKFFKDLWTLAITSSANKKSSKNYISKIAQSGVSLGRTFVPLPQINLLLMKVLLTPLAKSFLIPASATNVPIQMKIRGSGTALINSNKAMENIMTIVKSYEESGLLIKGVSKTIEKNAKGEKFGFFSILLGTLDVNLFKKLLTDARGIQVGGGIIKADQDF